MKRYFRISGKKYIDKNHSEKDFCAWQWLLSEAVGVDDNFELFKNLLWLRNNDVTITRAGRLDFYQHVGGSVEEEGIQQYIRDIKVGLYKKHGNKMTALLRKAAELVD